MAGPAAILEEELMAKGMEALASRTPKDSRTPTVGQDPGLTLGRGATAMDPRDAEKLRIDLGQLSKAAPNNTIEVQPPGDLVSGNPEEDLLNKVERLSLEVESGIADVLSREGSRAASSRVSEVGGE